MRIGAGNYRYNECIFLDFDTLNIIFYLYVLFDKLIIVSLLEFNSEINLLQFKMSQSSLSSILNQNKLTNNNFNDWKRNLIIVISFKKH